MSSFDGSDQSGEASLDLSGSFDDTPPPKPLVRPKGPGLSVPQATGIQQPDYRPGPSGLQATGIQQPGYRLGPSGLQATGIQQPGYRPQTAPIPQPAHRFAPQSPRKKIMQDPRVYPSSPRPETLGQQTEEEASFQWQDQTIYARINNLSKKYENLANSNDIGSIRNFVRNYYQHIIMYDYVKEKLKELVTTFGTPEHIRMGETYEYEPDTTLKIVRVLLENCQSKLSMMDISMEIPSSGAGLAVAIEKSKKKIFQVIDDLQATVRDQEHEIGLLKNDVSYMDELHAELNAARNHIMYLNERDKYAVLDPPPEQEFIEEMRYRMTMQDNLCSSYLQELELERESKSEIMNKFLRAEAQRVKDQQNLMKQMAETARVLDMQEAMRDGITSKMKSLSPDASEVAKAVDEWVRTTQEVIQQKQQEVQPLVAKLKEITNQLADKHIKIDERNQELAKSNNELQMKQEEVRKVNNELNAKSIEGNKLRTDYEYMEKEVDYLKDLRDQMAGKLSERREDIASLTLDQLKALGQKGLEFIPEEKVERTPGFATVKRGRGRGIRPLTPKQFSRFTPEMREQLSPQLRQKFSPDTKGLLRRSPSPTEYAAQLDESPFIISSPPPPSPTDIPAISITPPTVADSSPRIYEVISPPVTTPPPETPFVSKSRFGYTDPTVSRKKLNIPPGPFQILTPFRQTVVLTSPKRNEPLLVNIGVDPKPLTDTEKGECFVCDISLDVQPGGYGMLPQLSQVITPDRIVEGAVESGGSPVSDGSIWRRNVPPDITPTTTRRHGLSTPTGVFKRRQYNIRRVPGRHPIPELPWSPTYLPEDERSPVSPFPRSPYWSDRSISWDRSEGDYVESTPSPSPVIKGPSYRRRSPDPYFSDSASPSPVIKGPHYRRRSPDPYFSDHRSPSPVIKGPSYGHRSPDPYFSDSASPSPVIKGPHYRRRSPAPYFSDRSSPSPVIKGPRYRYPRNITSPEITSPPSGYMSEHERSGTPEPIRTYDSESPHYGRYEDDPLNRMRQFDGEAQVDDLNRRWQPEEMFTTASSSYSPMNQIFQSSVRRQGTPNRQFSPNGSDSMESEGDYMEGSLHDSSLLNEAGFFQ